MIDEDARAKVATLLESTGEALYPSDIADRLALPYDQVWIVLKQLQDADLIEPADLLPDCSVPRHRES